MTINFKPNGDGSAEIQVNAVTQIAISAAGVVTFPNTPNTQLGVGQTWQDVSSSRVSGTTYTNNTSKPITVNITAASLGSTGVIVRVGGVIIQNISALANYPPPVNTFIVPVGATYSVTFSGTGGISFWVELR